jgi:ribosome biogenesis GTPase
MEERIATVVKNAGSHYLLSELPKWEPFPAVLRGKVRLQKSSATNPVAVGDKVSYITADEKGPLFRVASQPYTGKCSTGAIPSAVITEILPRQNYVIRKSTNLSRQAHVIAANLDQAVIAVSLFFPEIKLPFLDRILVTCEVYKIPVVIVLNKVDLYRNEAPEALAEFHRIYEGAGYRVIDTSCKTGEGIDALREACAGKLSLFSGESGVGKSSLIKAVDPSLDPKIGNISLAHLQGKHTTSLYEMYPINSFAGRGMPPEDLSTPGQGQGEGPVACDGRGRSEQSERSSSGGIHSAGIEAAGYIIDSPGLRGFGLVDLEKEEISKYFPEMLRVADECRFVPCTHTHEPGCAVKAAVDAGEISAERYNSYLGMLEEDGKFR